MANHLPVRREDSLSWVVLATRLRIETLGGLMAEALRCVVVTATHVRLC